MYDLIIIGAGPAGLGAAIYAVRAGLDAVVLDKSPVSGGQVLTTYDVDNYLGFPNISGSDLCDAFRKHAEALGVKFMTACVTGIESSRKHNGDIKLVSTENGVLEAGAVLLAMGARHMKLGVSGEEKLAGRGVSYCATCDGAFFRNREVAVVGGGDVAVEDALFLSGICRRVYLIHRRDKLRAARSLQDRLMALENVEILWDSELKSIEGSEYVENITVYNKKQDKTGNLAVDGVFIAVGIRPNTEFLDGKINMDASGYIIAGEDCRTSEPGIFAAGDIRKKPIRQIVTAVSDGANSINSVQNYFNENIK